MNNWAIFQMDVKKAFLLGRLKKLIYMKPPPGYTVNPSLVCQLKRSLYGLKQTSRAWFERFREVILAANFTQSDLDYSLFIKMQDHKKTFFLYMLMISLLQERMMKAFTISNFRYLKL